MGRLDLHLTVLNRILIHLMDYRNFREEFEVPFEVTQSGISKGIRIQQKHLPRTLKKLIGLNHIEERTTHVVGVKQKRKVYFLTDEGIQYTWELIKNLMEKDIPIQASLKGKRSESVLKSIPLKELYESEKSKVSLIEILLFLQDNDAYNQEVLYAVLESDEQSMNNVDDNGESASDEISSEMSGLKRIGDQTREDKESMDSTMKIPQVKKIEIYHAALKQAWEDGRVTKDEHDILARLQDKLDISAEEHRRLEMEIMAKSSDKVGSEDVYKSALRQAWEDGVISDDEDSLLKELRRTLKITDEQHARYEKELKAGKKGR
ncbi:MAG: TerB family tellurite resistance protein [Thermoplasmata archaeon]|nr:MAG: TerB family tellurite resistance protein [Thermoplasmata archaeon]